MSEDKAHKRVAELVHGRSDRADYNQRLITLVAQNINEQNVCIVQNQTEYENNSNAEKHLIDKIG
jgi:hypothetical protein